MSFFSRCLLPVAVTRPQRIVCQMAGGVAVVLTVAGACYIIKNNEEYVYKKIDRGIDNAGHATIRKLPSAGECSDESNLRFAGSMFVLSLLGSCCGLGVLYDTHKETRNRINGTTKCCNIIKSTMWYCTAMPLIGFATTTFILFSKMSFDASRNHLKKIMDKQSTSNSNK